MRLSKEEMLAAMKKPKTEEKVETVDPETIVVEVKHRVSPTPVFESPNVILLEIRKTNVLLSQIKRILLGEALGSNSEREVAEVGSENSNHQ